MKDKTYADMLRDKCAAAKARYDAALARVAKAIEERELAFEERNAAEDAFGRAKHNLLVELGCAHGVPFADDERGV